MKIELEQIKSVVEETKEFAESQDIEFTETITELVEHALFVYREETKKGLSISEELKEFSKWINKNKFSMTQGATFNPGTFTTRQMLSWFEEWNKSKLSSNKESSCPNCGSHNLEHEDTHKICLECNWAF